MTIFLYTEIDCLPHFQTHTYSFHLPQCYRLVGCSVGQVAWSLHIQYEQMHSYWIKKITLSRLDSKCYYFKQKWREKKPTTCKLNAIRVFLIMIIIIYTNRQRYIDFNGRKWWYACGARNTFTTIETVVDTQKTWILQIQIQINCIDVCSPVTWTVSNWWLKKSTNKICCIWFPIKCTEFVHSSAIEMLYYRRYYSKSSNLLYHMQISCL